MELASTDTISHLKLLICERTDISPNQQVLYLERPHPLPPQRLENDGTKLAGPDAQIPRDGRLLVLQVRVLCVDVFSPVFAFAVFFKNLICLPRTCL